MGGLGRRADARDRRGALRRPGHRHRPLHLREHDTARAPDGGRADRGRRRRARASTAASTRACRSAKLELLGARAGGVRRFDDGRAHRRGAATPRTSPRPAPRTATPRASSTSCAPCRARRSRCSCARQRRARGPAQGLAARHRRRRRRVGDRPRLRRRRPPPRRRLLDDLEPDELIAFLRAAIAAQLHPSRGRRRAAGHAALTARSPRRLGRRARFDKPPGSPRTTSSRPCAARSASAAPRVGHAGTLDPFATGLLIVLVGRATRLRTSWRCRRPTRRRAARRALDTGDPEGEIVDTGRDPARARRCRTGEVRQRPPAYSAVKVGGERAYKRARRGESFEMPERTSPCTASRAVARARARTAAEAGYGSSAGSGTYVRSLIADLGDAYCLELRRTAIGPFEVGDGRSAAARRAGSELERGAARLRRGARALERALATAGRADAATAPACVVGFAAVKVTAPARRRARRPRAVAVGTFDGVHLGHREVIAGADTRAHLRAAPGRRSSRPQHTPQAADTAAAQGRADRVARRGGADRGPFDAASPRAAPQRVHRRGARRRARRHAGLGRRELPLRQRARRATPALLAADGRFEHARASAARGRRRGRLLEPDPRR